MTALKAPTLADFTGTWNLTRVIDDHRTQSTGRFEGVARYLPDENGLSYVETGQLYLPGQPPFQAERRYRWRDVAGVIHVEFDDGRFFHSFGATCPNATHWCDPDTYHVTYDFADWPVWHSKWEVSGPRKAYKMVNSYTRSAS